MIRLQQVSKLFRSGTRDVPALQGVDLHVARGEILGVVGYSGAGKSTLIRLLNRLETSSGGRIELDGEDVTTLQGEELRNLRRNIGMIFQHFNLLGSRTVAENIAMPLRIAGTRDANSMAGRVAELLALVGLSDHGDKYPAELSGGQKQRVGIARALANDPKVLLCDEATSALDPQTTRSILDLLLRINEQMGLTILLITHEMNVIRTICDRVAVLDAGVIVESGPVMQVFMHPRHPTTRHLVQESDGSEASADSDARAETKGWIVRLTFSDQHIDEPLLSSLVRAHDVEFTILAGRIERIKRMRCGQLTLGLTAAAISIQAALAQLAEQGVHVEILREAA